ncbi:uncharacterized protein LOC128393093 [Panonychus citri]|uniref:uncharacterized protein LOC128393093 n=1 Tax=Panonychus citri TaxID=50023 RepID=UPI002307D9AE|nr:uncharacterized protein LOC128393093 [Panonychus citri]
MNTINGDKKITYAYSPLNHQRSKSSYIIKLTYFLTIFNLVVFIWLISSSRSNYVPVVELNKSCGHRDELEFVSNKSLPSYWKRTSLTMEDQCLQATMSEDNFNFQREIDLLEKCQSSDYTRFWTSPNRYFTFLPINILPVSNKKIVSFSLYGGADRYLRNVVKIIRRYKKLLPDWIPRFWLGSDVPFLMINRLVYEQAEVIIVHQNQPKLSNLTRSPGYQGMFWRFFVADDQHVERYIVRDSDSMLIQREVDAMNQWIKEDTMFHVMRDHKNQSIEILGGMWGGKVDTKIFSTSREYEKALKSGFNNQDGKGLDQTFLQRFLWPIAKRRMTCHTAYRWKFVDSKGCKDFPTPRVGNSFVGAILED